MRVPGAAMLAVACLTIAGCGGITDPSKNTVDTFSGTLPVGGTTLHGFSASKTGELSVKLTALAPTSNGTVVLTWTQSANDGSCGGVLNQAFAQLNVPTLSSQIVSGRYCIVVQDVGSFTVPQTYTIAVSHP
jgi:hypothetical protein